MNMRTFRAILLMAFIGVCTNANQAYAHGGGGHGGFGGGHGGFGGGHFGGFHGGGYYGGGWRGGVYLGLGFPYYGYGYGYGLGYGSYPYYYGYGGYPYYSFGYPSYAPVAGAVSQTYIQQPAPVQQQSTVAPGNPQNPAGYWYYCNNPAGYYPYVKSCSGAWQPVSPTPPPQ
jgi:hypothetical protein